MCSISVLCSGQPSPLLFIGGADCCLTEVISSALTPVNSGLSLVVETVREPLELPYFPDYKLQFFP